MEWHEQNPSIDGAMTNNPSEGILYYLHRQLHVLIPHSAPIYHLGSQSIQTRIATSQCPMKTLSVWIRGTPLLELQRAFGLLKKLFCLDRSQHWQPVETTTRCASNVCRWVAWQQVWGAWVGPDLIPSSWNRKPTYDAKRTNKEED